MVLVTCSAVLVVEIGQGSFSEAVDSCMHANCGVETCTFATVCCVVSGGAVNREVERLRQRQSTLSNIWAAFRGTVHALRRISVVSTCLDDTTSLGGHLAIDTSSCSYINND